MEEYYDSLITAVFEHVRRVKQKQVAYAL